MATGEIIAICGTLLNFAMSLIAILSAKASKTAVAISRAEKELEAEKFKNIKRDIQILQKGKALLDGEVSNNNTKIAVLENKCRLL